MGLEGPLFSRWGQEMALLEASMADRRATSQSLKSIAGASFIALGLFIMWGSSQWSSKPVASTSRGGDPRTTLNEAVVFGGLERRMTSQDFQGGDITAIFGGIELDLTEANIQTNE